MEIAVFCRKDWHPIDNIETKRPFNMTRPTVTAIPVCCKRIAYHFAWCTHVILIETVGDRILRQHTRSMAFAEAWDMARALVALNIDQLVCGAMPVYFRDWFESKKVRIIDGQRGDEQDFFEKFSGQVRDFECPDRTHSKGRTVTCQNNKTAATALTKGNRYEQEGDSDHGQAVGRQDGQKKQGDLIREIQRAEGNFDCFGSAGDDCDQLECLFRKMCLKQGK